MGVQMVKNKLFFIGMILVSHCSFAQSGKSLKLANESEVFVYAMPPLKTSSIPVFDFIEKKLKHGLEIKEVGETVPRIEIGKEPKAIVPAQIFVDLDPSKSIKFNDLKKLPQIPSPYDSFDFASVEPGDVSKAKESPGLFVDQPVLQPQTVAALKPTILTPKPITLKNMQMEDKREKDFLFLSILYHDQQACSEVIMLSHYLMSKDYNKPEVRFYLGSCQHKKKLYSESVPLLASVIRTGIDYYTQQAVEHLLDDLPTGYEEIIADALAPIEVYRKLDQKQKDFYNYILAKGRFIEGKFLDSSKLAEIVSSKSKFYRDAQFLLGASEYLRDNAKGGIQILNSLASKFSETEYTSDLYSLTQLTLGRFNFELAQYKEAIKAYDKVNRQHPMWFDSLTEKGWTQIRLQQYPEAIGNMYTLHSPFFKSVFKPETYVIRTIGYLNMCQFPDADKTLGYLEDVYPTWRSMVSEYSQKNISPYKTAMTYLAGDSQKDVDGLPFPVIREMIRDKEFIVVQKKLNNIIDEITFYNNAVNEIMQIRSGIKSDMASIQSNVDSIEAEIKRLDSKKKFDQAKAKEEVLSDEKRKLITGAYRLSLIDQGFVTYRKLTGDSTKRVIQIRDAYISQAEQTLKQAMISVDNKMAKVLKNNELLRYEVYANSGKNIRFRSAGGKVEGRSQASIQAQKKSGKGKDFGWEFKGEFWADEIGKFISNVENLCPKR
jgi:tetratricopeptide (TPR) repeat protein